MRLDKYLCDCGIGSRSVVKELIRKKAVTVNQVICVKPEQKIDESNDIVCVGQKPIRAVSNVCYLLNKPEGYVCATKDTENRTVLELIHSEDRNRNLFPIGRLDKDTDGMLLISDNGDLCHRLMAPGKHVNKTYLAQLKYPLEPDALHRLEEGVDIGDEKLTLPAKVAYAKDNSTITITIHEGRYHQVKRMLQAVENEVLHLRRIAIGGLVMEDSLLPGMYRRLEQQEIDRLLQ